MRVVRQGSPHTTSPTIATPDCRGFPFRPSPVISPGRPTGGKYGLLEKPRNFDPFGQARFAHLGYRIFDPCKVLVQGSILPLRLFGKMDLHGLLRCSALCFWASRLFCKRSAKFCLCFADGFAFLFEFFEHIENRGYFIVHTVVILRSLNSTFAVSSIAKFLLKAEFINIYTSTWHRHRKDFVKCLG